MGLPIPSSREMFDGSDSANHLSKRRAVKNEVKGSKEIAEDREAYMRAYYDAAVDGYVGKTTWSGKGGTRVPTPDGTGYQNVPLVTTDWSKADDVRKARDDFDMAKSTQAPEDAWGNMTKEWTLANPIPTGLVPFDLEAPAKLLTPRPTPFRNMIPRVKGQGTSRRIKVVSGFTGTGTGGQTTLQSGITESSTVSVGPGGTLLNRGPFIGYSGYDYSVNYVTTSLSDQVSWDAEFQGQGFEDVRSLSATALLYSTMLIDERLMIYGRGTTGNGYVGPLSGAPSNITVAAVSGSVAPYGKSFGTSATVFVLVAADAGDLLGTNGAMHQGPTSTINSAASVSVSSGQAVQVTIGTDVPGALGYNLYCASVVGGPYVYSGRTGYNVGYITSQPTSGPTTTSGAGDQSAVSTNYDGLLTNVSASGGFVSRVNGALSTTYPGYEIQECFGNLFESVKADPDEIWCNGFDRFQLSNAILGNAAQVGGYRIYITQDQQGAIAAGTVVTSLMNQFTGTQVPLTVHPWFPQGNILVRQRELPIPDSNVAETSYMVLVQDYIMVNWPVIQFSYDASTFTIGTFAHVAPSWNGLIQGVAGVGIGTTPPSLGDS